MNAPPQWVYFFGDPSPDGFAPQADALRALLGGKGASLWEMTAAGLPVPPGFTITTECCRRFLEGGEVWPPGLDEQVHRGLARLEDATGRTFARGARPLLVSVRSGAAVSMPGMMDTLLNCGLHPHLAETVGDTPAFWRLYVQFILMFARTAAGLDAAALESRARTAGMDDGRAKAERLLEAYEELAGRAFPTDPHRCLAECVDAVFRSWNNDRAVAYRKRNDIRGLPGTAVNVQAMWPSSVSGILFTRDPGDAASDRMVIESSYGLGEAVVSGDVAPDRFRVERDGFAVVEVSIGRKGRAVAALGDDGPAMHEQDPDAPSLTDEQIAELGAVGLQIEARYGKAMDIEWGYAGGRLAVLQCRPIRGLDVAADVEIGRREEIARLRELADGRRRVWVAHNLGETLRTPTPLTWDIVRHYMSGDGGFGRMYLDFGFRPSPRARKDGFLELICGRIYADPGRVAEMFWQAMPLTYDLDAVADDPNLLNAPPTRLDPDRADGRFLLKLPGNIVRMIRAARRMKRMRRTARRRFDRDVLPPFLTYVRQERSRDLTKLPTEAVLAALRDRRRRVLDEFAPESLKPGFFAGRALAAVERLLAQLMGPAAAARLAGDLTAGLEADATFEQSATLYAVARGQTSMDEFIERFGHRCQNEMELSEPRFREDPAYVQQLVERVRSGARDPGRTHRENVRRRSQQEDSLPQTLARWGGSCFLEQLRADLQVARELLPYRETGKHCLMMGYELIRLAIIELARRWDVGNLVFFLKLDELGRFEAGPDRLLEAAQKRKVRWQSAQRLDMPDVIDSDELERLGLPRPRESADDLEADAVASGVATGPARIVFDPRQAADLGTGYVLVCPSTDPGWTPLFMNAAALVVERGGMLSHGAIVARDFGIPAVVCPDATRRIRPGDRLRVDGNLGSVAILPKTHDRGD